MATGAKLPPLADELKPPEDPAVQKRGVLGKAKHLVVRRIRPAYLQLQLGRRSEQHRNIRG